MTLKGLDGGLAGGRCRCSARRRIAGGGTYTHFTGKYSSRDGIFRAGFVLNPHMPLPSDHVFFNETDVGIGVTGTYQGDDAELTGTSLVGEKITWGSRETLHLLARLGAGWHPPSPFLFDQPAFLFPVERSTGLPFPGQCAGRRCADTRAGVGGDREGAETEMIDNPMHHAMPLPGAERNQSEPGCLAARPL